MEKEPYSSEIQNKLRNLAEKYKLNLLILFGSRAQGTQKKESDWDLCFYRVKELSIDEEFNIFEDIIKILKYEKIDIINLNKNHNHKLRNEIFMKGTPIFESQKGIFEKFKWQAWIDYQDFKRYYDIRSKIIKENLKHTIENG